DRKPPGQRTPAGNVLRLSALRRAQRHPRRPDRRQRQLLPCDPPGDLLRQPAARLLPPGRDAGGQLRLPLPLPRTHHLPAPHYAPPSPFHPVPPSRILEKPNHKIASCTGGKVSSAKAATGTE